MDEGDRFEAVLRYHERSKHRFDRYAPGPRQLDWRNQPDPFRRWTGAALTRLPLLPPPSAPRYDDLYRARAVPAAHVDLCALSRLLRYAFGLSAWKQAGGSRWPLRCNPSSGNLHPTEAYVLAGALEGLADAPALYHYAPREHALERRADCPAELRARMLRGWPPGALLVVLTAVHWREAWKYGERAFRYCQHDAEHAIGALRVAAAMLGWRAVVMDDTPDATLDALLGLNRDADFAGAEREAAELALVVWPAAAASSATSPSELDGTPPPVLDAAHAAELARQRWYGTANRLSRDDPVPWDAIDEVAQATRRSVSASSPPCAPDAAEPGGPPSPASPSMSCRASPASPPAPPPPPASPSMSFRASPASPASPAAPASPPSPASPATPTSRAAPTAGAAPDLPGGPRAAETGPTAASIVRQRRSLLACDGRTPVPGARFYAMLGRVMPRVERPLALRPMPWDAIPWRPAIHLALFVHRVEGLDPGLYALARDPARLDALKAAMQRQFEWTPPRGCPPDLPLHLLLRGDARSLATQVSCWQDIAGDGAFSLGMLAEYRARLVEHGPSFYRRLYWECGLIGQVLYLEAEAAGVRATGIGCFFDDPVHQVFGIGDLDFQSLYHFTVGGPVDDPRLSTLPPYPGREAE
jgi:SagB-type dehydrogenase family enzyme